MNPEAKEWLEEQVVNKHKWTNAFDEGGWRYGVNNTNLSEVLNKVLKGTCYASIGYCGVHILQIQFIFCA
jgi:hypothetical protein